MKQYNFVTKVASSSGNREYTIKCDEKGLFSCNCPSWVFNQRGNRTCKHIDYLRQSGFDLGGDGKLLLIKTSTWHAEVPKLCKNYPDKCGACDLRFACYTEQTPVFSAEEDKKRTLI